MSLIYRMAYRFGFAPWERAAVHPSAAAQIAALLDREERKRSPPCGRALDLGCGRGHWSVELASRGWQVTGVDLVPAAVEAARERAKKAGAAVRFVEGDMTALRACGIEPAFDFFWDFGAFHGLSQDARSAVGREVDALAAPGATMTGRPRRRASTDRSTATAKSATLM